MSFVSIMLFVRPSHALALLETCISAHELHKLLKCLLGGLTFIVTLFSDHFYDHCQIPRFPNFFSCTVFLRFSAPISIVNVSCKIFYFAPKHMQSLVPRGDTKWALWLRWKLTFSVHFSSSIDCFPLVLSRPPSWIHETIALCLIHYQKISKRYGCVSCTFCLVPKQTLLQFSKIVYSQPFFHRRAILKAD